MKNLKNEFEGLKKYEIFSENVTF